MLRIKVYKDRSKILLGLSQSTYIDKMLKRFSMEQSKRGYVPMLIGITILKSMRPKTQDERTHMSMTPICFSYRINHVLYVMYQTQRIIGSECHKHIPI